MFLLVHEGGSIIDQTIPPLEYNGQVQQGQTILSQDTDEPVMRVDSMATVFSQPAPKAAVLPPLAFKSKAVPNAAETVTPSLAPQVQIALAPNQSKEAALSVEATGFNAADNSSSGIEIDLASASDLRNDSGMTDS